MKKILILVSFLLSIQTVFSQSENIDTILQKTFAEKDDNARIDLAMSMTLHIVEINPLLDMQICEKALLQSQKNKDKIIEALALSGIGNNYLAFGNNSKSVEYNFKATALAQETGNEKLIAITKQNLAHAYKVLSDYPKAIRLYLSAEESFSKLNDYVMQTLSLNSLAVVYLLMNNLDSALIYVQRNYELCMRNNYYDFLSYTYGYLGSIHGKMGNSSLAISYFNLGIKEGFRIKSARALNTIYTHVAQYYYDSNQNDSCVVYSKKAIAVVHQTAFSNRSINSAKLLLDIYRNSNIDSAFKYSEMFRIANDSLFSAKTIQQTQLLTFEEELRQQKLTSEIIKAEEQRKQNLQYALIAFGFVTFLILFILLSRSFITNTKLIEFLGVMALLIVFEFLNLLLHPFLERITNHTPVLMLSVLVGIAAFLIPLHHRVEKWATVKLVEKNKKIRLAIAKKTIAKLEDETVNISND